jgi:putative Holliday junction resolvase
MVSAVVVGLPRGLNGQATEQTVKVQQFADRLRRTLAVPIYLQDEALTSRLATTELRHRRKAYNKGDIDALSACYILEDWLHQHQEDNRE